MNEQLFPVSFNSNDGCNVSDDTILQQVSMNIRRQLPQVMPHAANKDIIALVCGGPSLAITEKELVQAYWNGAKVVALNGTYQWCIDHNIKPSVVVMLDARRFNSRFIMSPVEGCKYLLASQCHPETFDLCQDRDVTVFHCCSCGELEHSMLKQYYFGRLFPIPIGTTVAIKAIQIMSMLGFKLFDIFGMDSCWMDDQHHCYPQAENDQDKYIPVWLKPDGYPELAEKFFCAPWMMRQALDFQKLVHDRGNDFVLNVHGNGLIAATMKISAKLGSPTIGLSEGD